MPITEIVESLGHTMHDLSQAAFGEQRHPRVDRAARDSHEEGPHVPKRRDPGAQLTGVIDQSL